MRRRLPLVLSWLLLAGVAAAIGVAGRLLQPALGFVAKQACSGVLAGGATVEQAEAAFPDTWLRHLLQVRVDSAAGRADAHIPLLGRRHAVRALENAPTFERAQTLLLKTVGKRP